MKALVLAEKPSVGQELSRVLGCTAKARGYSEGPGHVVSWAMGHLVELAEPHAYDEKYRHWSLDSLPMLPPEMRHRVIPRSSQQFRTIKGLFQRKDIGELIIATDAGREGELVARWILYKCGWKKKVRRLWISSQTDEAIRDGFKNLRPGEEYWNLFQAAACRASPAFLGPSPTKTMQARVPRRPAHHSAAEQPSSNPPPAALRTSAGTRS